MKRKIIIVVAVLTVLLLSSLGFLGFTAYHTIDSSINSMQSIDKNEIKIMQNENLTEEQIEALEGIWTVAFFGIDSRDATDLSDGNSDVIMIGVLDTNTGDIKLLSVYRDTCLKTGANTYMKANSAYASGGPKQAVKMLNENFDLQIDDYIAVNWGAVATAINILGGVDINVTNAEFRYINGYITETVNSTGIGSYQLKSAGYQHLDGVQTVAYCRLRYSDNDFKRTERQREVIAQLLEKAKAADWATVNNIIVTVLPMTSTSIETRDIIRFGKYIFDYNLVGSEGFPFDLYQKKVDNLDYVFPDTLTSNVTKLHEFLYNEKDYKPSSAVKNISSKIIEKSNKETKNDKKDETESEIISEEEALQKFLEQIAEMEETQESETSLKETEKETETTEGNISETIRDNDKGDVYVAGQIHNDTGPGMNNEIGPGYSNTEETEPELETASEMELYDDTERDFITENDYIPDVEEEKTKIPLEPKTETETDINAQILYDALLVAEPPQD